GPALSFRCPEMVKYLHDVLSLLHDFLNDRHEDTRLPDARLADDKALGADPERCDARVRRHPIT
ncbi:MAG TPA: hypothetical protein VMQ11_00440, partial [Alphaproteobacteria bacterium]|nr:hypothetical protein [Alphaproteobacteria bacterium]